MVIRPGKSRGGGRFAKRWNREELHHRNALGRRKHYEPVPARRALRCRRSARSNRAYMHTCRRSGCTVVSGVVVVVVVVCNRSQMRTSKCTCLIFVVSIGLDPG